MVWVRPSARRRFAAVRFGRYPSLSAAARTRSTSSGATVGTSLNTLETVLIPTPASAATSRIVARSRRPSVPAWLVTVVLLPGVGRTRLEQSVSAVDHENRARHEARRGTGQVDDGRRDLLGERGALLRRVADPAGRELRTVHRRHVGADVPGSHRVDPDAEGRPLRRQRPGEVVHRRLRRVVGRLPLRPVDDLARHPPDVHDRARAALDHRPPEDLAPVPHPGDVGLDHLSPLRLGDLQGGTVDAGAGVVHEHVDGAQALGDLVRRPLKLRPVGTVSDGGLRRDAAGSQLRDDVGVRRLVAGDHGHPRTGLAEGTGEGPSQAAVAAGDDGDPARDGERVENAHRGEGGTADAVRSPVCSSVVAPVMIDTASDGVWDFGVMTPTPRPSRWMWIRSATSNTFGMLWLIRMMPSPRSRRSLTRRSTCPVSRTPSAAVGSSRMTTLLPNAAVRATATT